MATTLASLQHGDFESHNCLTSFKAHCTIWLATLKYSEKHKTILKYQQAMATSTHEKMGFEIQIGDIIISPSPLWAKMEIQFERASLL